MPAYSPNVGQFWSAFLSGERAVDAPGFAVWINPELRPQRKVVIVTHEDGSVEAALTPSVATAIGGLGDVATVGALRDRIASAGITLADEEWVHYLSLGARDELLRAPHHPRIRHLTAADAAAFAAFHAACPEDDREEAFVELDHWAVVGLVHDDRILAVSSAYPWKEGPVADIGVLTLPEERGHGYARAVTHAMSAHIIGQGLEPQYRCDPSNVASAGVARAAGFTRVYVWQTVGGE